MRNAMETLIKHHFYKDKQEAIDILSVFCACKTISSADYVELVYLLTMEYPDAEPEIIEPEQDSAESVDDAAEPEEVMPEAEDVTPGEEEEQKDEQTADSGEV